MLLLTPAGSPDPVVVDHLPLQVDGVVVGPVHGRAGEDGGQEGSQVHQLHTPSPPTTTSTAGAGAGEESSPFWAVWADWGDGGVGWGVAGAGRHLTALSLHAAESQWTPEASFSCSKIIIWSEKTENNNQKVIADILPQEYVEGFIEIIKFHRWALKYYSNQERILIISEQPFPSSINFLIIIIGVLTFNF